MATATVVTGVSSHAGVVINSATDVDLIKCLAGAGNLVITPKVALSSPDMRMQIKVLNAAGTAIATYDATGTVGNMAPAAITLNVPLGPYYIQVDGIGSGASPAVGYDEYGSIGYYSFSASWADPIQPPVPAISAFGLAMNGGGLPCLAETPRSKRFSRIASSTARKASSRCVSVSSN